MYSNRRVYIDFLTRVKDILVACVDGLKGFPEAIDTVFPDTQVQLCIVHMIRHSLNYLSWKQRKEFAAVAADLKAIYSAPTVEEAEYHLERFEGKWTMPIRNWRSALKQFSIMFEERMPLL